MKQLLLLLILSSSQLVFGQNGTVRGICYDKETGESIPFAKVILYTSDSVIVKGEVTDIDGFFSFGKILPGSYHLQFENIEYDKTYIPLDELKAGEIISKRVFLKPDSDPIPIHDIELHDLIDP